MTIIAAALVFVLAVTIPCWLWESSRERRDARSRNQARRLS